MRKIAIDEVFFTLDPEMVYQGDPENKEDLEGFEKIKAAHIAMDEEFKDKTNLAEFTSLLVMDNNTAFLKYNHARGREF